MTLPSPKAPKRRPRRVRGPMAPSSRAVSQPRWTNSPARRLADAHPEEPARQMLIYAGLKDVDLTVDALQRTARLNPWRARTWMARPEIAPVLQRDARAVALREQLHVPGGCGGE